MDNIQIQNDVKTNVTLSILGLITGSSLGIIIWGLTYAVFPQIGTDVITIQLAIVDGLGLSIICGAFASQRERLVMDSEYIMFFWLWVWFNVVPSTIAVLGTIYIYL
jgi:hypothetical protein